VQPQLRGDAAPVWHRRRHGYARVNDRAHWASDVIAGGLVGTLIGRTIVRRHERDEAQPEAPPAAYSFRIAPVVSAGSLGFTASASF
jgi:hypothetical protein